VRKNICLVPYDATPLDSMAIRTTQRQRNGQRSRRICFTLNNWTDSELIAAKSFAESKCTWAVIGKETGESGTPHLQGAMVFKNPIAFSTIKAGLPRAHIEVMHGTAEDNLAYCSKEDTSYWVFGTMPQQGKRKDLDDVAELIQNGATLEDIATTHPTAIIKFSRGLSVLRSICSGKRDPTNPPAVYWLFGATGTGKTRAAYEWAYSKYGDADTLLLPDSTLKWFDTYDGQQCVIIDDFRAKGVTFSFLLRILDRYPVCVPIKGAFVNWKPEVIIITTPVDIRGTFAKRAEHLPEDIRQLERRVTAQFEFPRESLLFTASTIVLGGCVGGMEIDSRGDMEVEPTLPTRSTGRLGTSSTSITSRPGVLARSPFMRSNATLTQCICCCEAVEHVNQRRMCTDCSK